MIQVWDRSDVEAKDFEMPTVLSIPDRRMDQRERERNLLTIKWMTEELFQSYWREIGVRRRIHAWHTREACRGVELFIGGR
jgi:hypothetical protein